MHPNPRSCFLTEAINSLFRRGLLTVQATRTDHTVADSDGKYNSGTCIYALKYPIIVFAAYNTRIICIFGGNPCIFEESPPVFTVPGPGRTTSIIMMLPQPSITRSLAATCTPPTFPRSVRTQAPARPGPALVLGDPLHLLRWHARDPLHSLGLGLFDFHFS